MPLAPSLAAEQSSTAPERR